MTGAVIAPGSERRRRRLRRILVASVLAIAASMVAASAASAVLAGKNGRIVFTSGRNGPNDNTAQIYLRTVVGSSGGGALGDAIGIPGVQNRHPSWSPDRTKVVFAAGEPGSPTTEQYDLYVRDLVENTITPLDGTEIGDGLSSDHPAWSPDGTRIAYEHQTSAGSAQRDIMVKTVGTATPATALTTGGPIEFKAAWSPDSQTIYYASQQATPPASNLDIVKRPAAGGPETPVSNATGIDEYQPSISPDGSKICFTLQTTPGNPASAEIYTAELPGMTGLTNLSDDPAKGDINCTWSPDGRLIAYSNGVYGQGRLVMERSDDSDPGPVLLEDDQGSDNFDGNPDWAPDGSPDCPDSAVPTPVGTPVVIELECVDTGPAYERSDPNGYVTVPPLHGTLSDDQPTANPSTVTYTPEPGFVGYDLITFSSFDAFGFGTDDGLIVVRVGAKCGGRDVTVLGLTDSDRLEGTPGRDVVLAGLGDDRVKTGKGNDTVCAGDGDDRVSGGAGKDRLLGGSGDDRLRGGRGRDSCAGGPGRDRLDCERTGKG